MVQAPLLDEPARDALRHATAALDTAERGGQAIAISQAMAHVAACYRHLNALASAEACYERALRWGRHAGAMDQVVDLLCELSDTIVRLAQAQDAQRAGGGRAARERARDHAFEAPTLAGRVADPGWEATVLLRISDVLDRCGDRDDAVQLQTRALRLMSGGPGNSGHDPNQLPGLGRLADG